MQRWKPCEWCSKPHTRFVGIDHRLACDDCGPGGPAPRDEDRLPSGRSTEALLDAIRDLVDQVPDASLRRVILSICAELDGSED